MVKIYRKLTEAGLDKKDIEKEFNETGLKVDRIIEGKAMYIVVGKR